MVILCNITFEGVTVFSNNFLNGIISYYSEELVHESENFSSDNRKIFDPKDDRKTLKPLITLKTEKNYVKNRAIKLLRLFDFESYLILRFIFLLSYYF